MNERQEQIEVLKSVVSPPHAPKEVGSSTDWGNLCNQLETKVPNDYEDIILAYGSGGFDEFLYLFNPFSTNDEFNLISRSEYLLSLYKELNELDEEVYPYPGYGSEYKLLPWASTANGDVLFWLYELDSKQSSTIAVNQSRTIRWELFSSTITEFLIDVLSSKTSVKAFPDSFPSKQPMFESF